MGKSAEADYPVTAFSQLRVWNWLCLANHKWTTAFITAAPRSRLAQYQHIDTNLHFQAVDLLCQRLPGTSEHALNHLIKLARIRRQEEADTTPSILRRGRYASLLDLHP